MGETLAQKIIRAHLLHGDMTPGSEIALRIDQTLTQDATGTMAYLEFETMGIPRVRTELSVAYVDHNTLQSGFENADDHRYLQTVAKKHGVWFSRPGNGICHQVQLERFGKPGKTLIGSDSHTPTGGGIGMLAFGAGGMDVAVAMGGGAYYITMPKMFKVNLTGALRPYVTAKDISLELLRILSVKGGVGAIIEWGGPGIAALSVPERATITNMGTELGATTSIFPSDDVTRAFLAAEGRAADFVPLASDPDAQYDRIIDIDLNTLQPMIACPHSPDNVVPVASLAGTKVDQVCIGSCTNSSLFDMLKVAALVPMYLGIRCVVAKSFARIHVANLINAGILPLTFADPEDYDALHQGAHLRIGNIRAGMAAGELTLTDTAGKPYPVVCSLTERQQAILLAGGLLNYTKEHAL